MGSPISHDNFPQTLAERPLIRRVFWWASSPACLPARSAESGSRQSLVIAERLDRSIVMKSFRLKTWLLAASGLVAFQVAGCDFADQIQSQLANLQSLFPSIPGIGI